MSTKRYDYLLPGWRDSASLNPRLRGFFSNSEELAKVLTWLRYRDDMRAHRTFTINDITPYQVKRFRRISKNDSFVMPKHKKIVLKRTLKKNARRDALHMARMNYSVPPEQIWYDTNAGTPRERLATLRNKDLSSIYQRKKPNPADKGSIGNLVEFAVGLTQNSSSKRDTPEGEIKSTRLVDGKLISKDDLATSSFSWDINSRSRISQELLNRTPFLDSSFFEKIKLMFLVGIDMSIEGSTLVKEICHINFELPDFEDILARMENEWDYLSWCFINQVSLDEIDHSLFFIFRFGTKGAAGNNRIGRCLYIRREIVQEMFIRGIAV